MAEVVAKDLHIFSYYFEVFNFSYLLGGEFSFDCILNKILENYK